MEPLQVIGLIIESYKEVVNKLKIKYDDEQKQNRERSKAFIRLVSTKLQNKCPRSQGFEVFSREILEKSIFRLKEYLFDVNVCEFDYVKSAVHKVNVPYIKRSLLQMESEFSEDLFNTMVDFNKLVCGKSDLKIMVLPLSDNVDNYCVPLENAASNVEGELYLIFLPHPSKWNESTEEVYKIYKFNRSTGRFEEFDAFLMQDERGIEEVQEYEEFELMDDDYYAVDIGINTVRRLLKHPKITPQQVIGLGNALYALERLPQVTDGVWCEFSIVYSKGTEGFSETRYIEFRISESKFEISQGGSAYDESVGSDCFPESRWVVEVSGYRDTECELYDIEDDIEMYLNHGAEISVSDASVIDYE